MATKASRVRDRPTDEVGSAATVRAGFFRWGRSSPWLELPSPMSFDMHDQRGFASDVPGVHETSHRVGKSTIRWFTIDGFRTVHSIGGDPEEERPRPCSTNVALFISNLEAVLTRLEQHGVT
jgi:hypothetical protein